MPHRIVWVHGIGPHRDGYSMPWRTNFNVYLKLLDDCFVEVNWNSVFQAAEAATRGVGSLGGADDVLALSPQEQLAEEQVRADLSTLLLARASAVQPPTSSDVGSLGGDEEIVEWSAVGSLGSTRGAFDWLWNPDEYIGDFAKYLVSQKVRTAVKEKAKEKLRALLDDAYSISIIAHSWGTVVSYEALLDLEVELPQLKTVNLITLGSPLWMVRPMLQERTGRKPGTLTRWVNVHARGDLVGSWLNPGFQVDHEFEVPNMGGAGAHSSYFVPNNEAVQRTIIARYVLD